MVTATATSFLHRLLKLLLSTLLLVSCGCGPEVTSNPAAVYARADALRRAGNMSKAQQEAQRGYAAWQNRPETVWHWKFRLLTAETLISQSQLKQAAPLLQVEPPAGLPDRDAVEARRDLSNAVVAYYQSRYLDGIALLDRGLRLVQHASAWGLITEIYIRRTGFDIRLSRPDAAESDAHAAIAAAKHTSDSYLQANALGGLGYFLANRFRFDEAVHYFQGCIDAARAADYQAVTGLALSNLGWCYYSLGDWNRASEYLEDADAIFGKAGLPARQQVVIANIGALRQSLDDFQGAIPFFQRALEISTAIHDDLNVSKVLANLAAVYIHLGDLDTAERYNQRALEMQKTRHDPAENVFPILNAARIAAGRGKLPLARKLYRDALDLKTEDPDPRWEAHAGLADLAFRSGDVTGAHNEAGQAVAIIDASWSRLSNDQSKLTFPSRAMRFYREYVDFLVSKNRGEEALAFAESRRGRLLAEKMGVERSIPTATDFRRLARQEHAVLLSYWLGPEHSYLWVAAPEAFRTVTLPGEPKIRALVESYTRAIQDPRSSELVQNPAAHELYQTLVAPAHDLLPEGSRVIVVPDGCLHNLNLETLVTPANRFWIEDAAVEIAPSLLLLGGGKRNRRAEADSALLIGNAEHSDPDLPPLPYAAKEISGIAQLYRDNRELTGAAAKPEAYRAADPAQYSLIHFAAHAVPNQDSPLDSAVVLSPGKDTAKLYARQILSIPLQARLVTISACRSAGTRTFSSEGLVGLAWAFLSAGAQNVVASLWDVNDQSSASLMESLYGKLRSGEPPEEALHQVKLDFERAGGARGKPYYWAAFQLYTR